MNSEIAKQIERSEWDGLDGYANAEWKYGTWVCCSARIRESVHLVQSPQIQARATSMTMDQAEIVATALEMARQWCAEQLEAMVAGPNLFR